MARLPLLDPADMPEPEYEDAIEALPEEYKESRHLGEDRFQTSKVQRSMGHNPEIFQLHTNAYLTLWNRDVTGLEPRQNELVILTLGRAFRSKNEWNSHIQNAVAMGIIEEEIRAIAAEDFDALDETDSILARYVTAMADMSVTDELHAELAEHFDERTIVGIMVLCGYYALCAVVIEAMGVAADPGEGFEEIGYDALIG